MYRLEILVVDRWVDVTGNRGRFTEADADTLTDRLQAAGADDVRRVWVPPSQDGTLNPWYAREFDDLELCGLVARQPERCRAARRKEAEVA